MNQSSNLLKCCIPDRHVEKKVLEVMVHHEGIVKENSSIGDICDSDQVPDNVLE